MVGGWRDAVGGDRAALSGGHSHARRPLCTNAGTKPVVIELTDMKTKKVVDSLEVDACMVATGR